MRQILEGNRARIIKHPLSLFESFLVNGIKVCPGVILMAFDSLDNLAVSFSPPAKDKMTSGLHQQQRSSSWTL